MYVKCLITPFDSRWIELIINKRIGEIGWENMKVEKKKEKYKATTLMYKFKENFNI